MNNLGYTKTIKSVVQKVEHTIRFKVGCQQIDVLNMLNDIPNKATVFDFYEEGEDNNILCIKFREEKPQ